MSWGPSGRPLFSLAGGSPARVADAANEVIRRDDPEGRDWGRGHTAAARLSEFEGFLRARGRRAKRILLR